jgi:hypothetical protein
MPARSASSSRLIFALSFGLLLAIPGSRLAAQSVTLSGDPGSLAIGTATAGAPLDPVSDATTTYTVATSAAGQQIVARLDAPMPGGVTLSITLTAPTGAVSMGEVTLSTVDQTVVGSIPAAGTYAGLAITYQLSSATSAGPVATAARSVVFTVVSGT